MAILRRKAGAFIQPDARGNTDWLRDATFSIAGRAHYFWALDEHWAEVLSTLRVDVCPIYRPRRADFGELIAITESWERLQSDVERKDLLRSLRRWAVEFGITEDWIFETALRTLMRFSPLIVPRIQAENESWLWIYTPGGSHPPFRPTFEDNVWYPRPEGWQVFKRRMEKQFSAQLAKHRRLVEHTLGIGKDGMERDAKWTVLYKKGIPAFEIATELAGYDDAEQTVYRAVERFADSIGLMLRTHRRRDRRH
jgi:hypothetical protein